MRFTKILKNPTGLLANMLRQIEFGGPLTGGFKLLNDFVMAQDLIVTELEVYKKLLNFYKS